MKKIAFCLSLLVIGATVFAQEGDAAAPEAAASGFSLGGLFGGVTVDGKNYQMIGLRPDFHFWKIGLGLDITLLLDENGQPRTEDWDDWEDYLDKLYYISFGTRGDPFFFRYGGISSTSLGYGILINNYNNLREYPAVKRLGLDIGFETEKLGAQAFISNFKELWVTNPGSVVGGRIYAKPISRLQIGASFAGDLNEYNGLKDSDGDGVPDRIDHYPNDSSKSNEFTVYADVIGNDAANALLDAELIRDNNGDYTAKVTDSLFVAADMGFSVIKTDSFKFDIYAQIAQSRYSEGWGFTAPGVRLGFGDLLEISADYRQTNGGFLFGYFNDTYDLQRASFVKDATDTDKLIVQTKRQRLDNTEPLYGYFGSVKVNLFNVITGSGELQDLTSLDASTHDISWRFGLALQEGIIPKIDQVEFHYVQNNIPEWKLLTESTVLGASVGLNLGGTVIKLQYDLLCIDEDGSGSIELDRFAQETKMEFSVLTTVKF
jgi:hypothetical protein